MVIAFYILIALLGMVLASFAGVIIERGRGGFEFSRLPEILGGRSYCPGCNKKEGTSTLRVRQLIPVLGQLIQGGKCYRCESSIPWWYMWFELATGILFVLVTWLLVGSNLESLVGDGGQTLTTLFFWLLVVRASMAILVADLLWYELNVWMWLLLMVLLPAGGLLDILPLRESVFWMLILVAIFVGIYQFGRRYVKRVFGEDGEGFGQGDVMMAAVAGMLFPLATQGMDRVGQVQLVLVYLVLSSFMGMVFRYIRLLITNDKDAMMPFLPSMIIGFILLLVRGKDLVAMMG